MRNAIGFLSIAALIAGAQVAAGQEASQTAQSQSQSQSQSQAQTSAKPKAAPPQARKESVAEAARKAREAQKNAPKASTTFTNDNIAAAATGTINVVGNAPAPEAAASAQAGQAAAAPGAAPPVAGNDEASWRQKFADARTKFQQDQAELAIMHRELSQLQLQYYPDPSKALKQSVTNEDVIKKQQAIAKMQKQVQADQQAISNLEDDFRKSGGDSAWARE